jgi:hypothetical protein
MSLRFVRPLLRPLILAGLLLPAGFAPAMASVVSCSPTKMRIKTMTGTVSTNSNTFKSIPEAAITFTQGGTAPSCVVVRFSAASSVTVSGVSRIVARLDGVTDAEPGSVQFSGENVGSVAHSFDFLFPSVAPGAHTVRMMYRTNGTGTVFVDERVLVVQHVP